MKERSGKKAAPAAGAAQRDDEQPLLEYARLVSDLIHDFRTPLGSIVGAASVLDDYAGDIDEKIRSRLCSGIIDQAHRLDRLLTTLSAIARARSGTLVRGETVFELNELLRGLSTRMRDRHEVPVEVSALPEEIFLRTDPAVIQILLSLMLYLAFVYAPGEGRVRLSLTGEAEAASIAVECDVREEDRPRLQKLIGGDTPDPPPGTRAAADAVYLAATREVVHILGGEFRVQHDDAVCRLCQTVKLPTHTV